MSGPGDSAAEVTPEKTGMQTIRADKAAFRLCVAILSIVFRLQLLLLNGLLELETHELAHPVIAGKMAKSYAGVEIKLLRRERCRDGVQ
jgi:hypothetical protein